MKKKDILHKIKLGDFNELQLDDFTKSLGHEETVLHKVLSSSNQTNIQSLSKKVNDLKLSEETLTNIFNQQDVAGQTPLDYLPKSDRSIKAFLEAGNKGVTTIDQQSGQEAISWKNQIIGTAFTLITGLFYWLYSNEAKNRRAAEDARDAATQEKDQALEAQRVAERARNTAIQGENRALEAQRLAEAAKDAVIQENQALEAQRIDAQQKLDEVEQKLQNAEAEIRELNAAKDAAIQENQALEAQRVAEVPRYAAEEKELSEDAEETTRKIEFGKQLLKAILKGGITNQNFIATDDDIASLAHGLYAIARERGELFERGSFSIQDQYKNLYKFLISYLLQKQNSDFDSLTDATKAPYIYYEEDMIYSYLSYWHSNGYSRKSSHYTKKTTFDYGIDLPALKLPYGYKHLLFAHIPEDRNRNINVAKLFLKCEEVGSGSIWDTIEHMGHYFTPTGDTSQMRREKDKSKDQYSREEARKDFQAGNEVVILDSDLIENDTINSELIVERLKLFNDLSALEAEIQTLLEMRVDYAHVLMLPRILNSIQNQQIANSFVEEYLVDKMDNTNIHGFSLLMTNQYVLEAMKNIMQEKLIELALARDQEGDIAFTKVISFEFGAQAAKFWNEIEPSVMNNLNQKGDNLLHIIFKQTDEAKPNRSLVSVLKEIAFDKDQFLALLSQKNASGKTPIDILIGRDKKHVQNMVKFLYDKIHTSIDLHSIIEAEEVESIFALIRHSKLISGIQEEIKNFYDEEDEKTAEGLATSMLASYHSGEGQWFDVEVGAGALTSSVESLQQPLGGGAVEAPKISRLGSAEMRNYIKKLNFSPSEGQFESGGVMKENFFYKKGGGESIYIAPANDIVDNGSRDYTLSGERNIDEVITEIISDLQNDGAENGLKNQVKILIPLQQNNKAHWTLLEITLKIQSGTDRHTITSTHYDSKSQYTGVFVDWLKSTSDYISNTITKHFNDIELRYIYSGKQGVFDHVNCGRFTACKMTKFLYPDLNYNIGDIDKIISGEITIAPIISSSDAGEGSFAATENDGECKSVGLTGLTPLKGANVAVGPGVSFKEATSFLKSIADANPLFTYGLTPITYILDSANYLIFETLPKPYTNMVSDKNVKFLECQSPESSECFSIAIDILFKFGHGGVAYTTLKDGTLHALAYISTNIESIPNTLSITTDVNTASLPTLVRLETNIAELTNLSPLNGFDPMLFNAGWLHNIISMLKECDSNIKNFIVGFFIGSRFAKMQKLFDKYITSPQDAIQVKDTETFKKAYKKIALKTHHDKTKDILANKDFIEAKSLYENDDATSTTTLSTAGASVLQNANVFIKAIDTILDGAKLYQDFNTANSLELAVSITQLYGMAIYNPTVSLVLGVTGVAVQIYNEDFVGAAQTIAITGGYTLGYILATAAGAGAVVTTGAIITTTYSAGNVAYKGYDMLYSEAKLDHGVKVLGEEEVF